MPKKIKLKPHLNTAELENRYRQATDPVERSHYQIVWLIAQGKSTTEVMEITAYSRDWIQRLSRRYNHRGPATLGDKRHENPRGADRTLLDDEQREELAGLLKGAPSDGRMWNPSKVAQWIEQRTGRRVSPQRGWEYLRRLGSTPKVPRPSRAKSDSREQEAFKKASHPTHR